MQQEFWPYCLACLEQELPEQQFNTWIKPLPVEYADDDGDGAPSLTLKAPNRFFLQWVRDRYLRRIGELGEEFHGMPLRLNLQLAPVPPALAPVSTAPTASDAAAPPALKVAPVTENPAPSSATGVE
ncbi:MAG: chromosomal replication initiator protein DnaA, partial [Azoarcus sp.]|nr:chromosomal replication initiator protein DnaA [Azoarcus sp.]